jgi:flagellar L-ring protein precursor FlgH
MRNLELVLLALLSATVSSAANTKPSANTKRPPEPSALDKYIDDALRQSPPKENGATAGSLWTPMSRLTDLGSDLRASQVNDLVTILVAERASAIATGDVKTSRSSSVKSAIPASVGLHSAAGRLANLAQANTDVNLAGQGTTGRTTELSTTLSARITHVLPNGYLVVEGAKDVQVNSEHQMVVIRGIIRPVDLGPNNQISSDQLAQLEIKVNGKGVVGDAIRRPFFLYRLLLGLLPF